MKTIDELLSQIADNTGVGTPKPSAVKEPTYKKEEKKTDVSFVGTKPYLSLAFAKEIVYCIEKGAESMGIKAVIAVVNSPYNTYKNTGLPVGPIASPGEACIKAALYPEKTNALYFLLGTDGEHIFSETYEEHLKAMEANGL